MGVAAAIAGAAVVGAGASIISGNKAAKAATTAASQANATERYIFDTARADNAPFRDVGVGALAKLADMAGVPRSTGSAPTGSAGSSALYRGFGLDGRGGGDYYNQPDAIGGATSGMTAGFDGFKASPGYEFRLSEGLKAIERSASSRGSLRGGATMKASGRYADGTASAEYENFANRLASLAGVGQSATAANQQAGAQYANGFSNNTINAGNARASAYANTGNAINQGVSNLASAYLYNKGYGQRQPGGGDYGGRP